MTRNIYYVNKRNYLIILIFFSFLKIIISNICKDKNCDRCSGDGTHCFICKNEWIKFNYQCFKKSKTIKNCVLCNDEEDICVKCDYGCKPKDGECICTLKYILYIIYFLITVITIGVFLYCFTHNTLAIYYSNNNHIFSNFNEVNINNINNNMNQSAINQSINESEKSKEELLDEFSKSLVNINEEVDIEKKKCDCCNNMICNLHLDCGCYVCFDCEKKSIKNNSCLNCHKIFNKMRQITCSICFNNKKELGYFNCQCKMTVCKECYIKWRINNKNCPTCRANII